MSDDLSYAIAAFQENDTRYSCFTEDMNLHIESQLFPVDYDRRRSFLNGKESSSYRKFVHLNYTCKLLEMKSQLFCLEWKINRKK